MKNKLELLNSLMGANDNYFSMDWIMKMFNLNRNEIRKYKIEKIFNDEAREI